jgi:hypothetical protein
MRGFFYRARAGCERLSRAPVAFAQVPVAATRRPVRRFPHGAGASHDVVTAVPNVTVVFSPSPVPGDPNVPRRGSTRNDLDPGRGRRHPDDDLACRRFALADRADQRRPCDCQRETHGQGATSPNHRSLRKQRSHGVLRSPSHDVMRRRDVQEGEHRTCQPRLHERQRRADSSVFRTLQNATSAWSPSASHCGV